MKRTQKRERINRNNTTAFNNRYREASRTVTPDILVSQIWLEDVATPVEITELNSSKSVTSPESPEFNISEAWSYINDDRFQQLEDDYRINKKARDKRRLENNPKQFINPCLNCDNDEANNDFFSGLSTNDDGSSKNRNQTNCFSFVDKHFFSSNDTSDSGENVDIEVIQADLIPEKPNWDNGQQYNEEIITYDPDVDTEKRTIWIYSFKNKRLLSENDFDLVNIPSRDTSSCSTSYSTDTDEEQTKDKYTNVGRLGSPIPATYIPRLDLSLGQTLSTVTEITEPNKRPSLNDTETLVNAILTRKPINSWIGDSKKTVDKSEQSSNVVNWMALSPRERRRKFKNMNSYILSKELALQTRDHSFAQDKLQNAEKDNSESMTRVTKQVQVDVDINDIQCTTPKSSNSKAKMNIQPLKIMYADSYIDNDGEDRGDYNRKKLRKPQMKLTPRNTARAITDPIQKLDSNNWIAGESNEVDPANYDYDLGTVADVTDVHVRNASNRLWKKNMSLMKPAQWSEYLPITASPRTLHLSLSSCNEHESWFSRLFSCFKCFKSYV